MNKELFDIVNKLIEDLLINDEPIFYSSKSMLIIWSHFYSQLERSNLNDEQKKQLLENWGHGIQKFKYDLIESAKSTNSFVDFNGYQRPLIRESDAVEITRRSCPPPPKSIKEPKNYN